MKTMTTDRRLIEEVLPIRSISAEASREKSIRYGHISTLHIWWARRPLVACRAAILGALLRDPGPGKERNELVEFLEKFCTWEATNDPNMIEKARNLILKHNAGVPPKVLDCFAGGGAIPLEAIRMGCAAYALDLNPVAVLIELCTLVYPQKYGKPAEIEDSQKGLGGKKTIPNRLSYDVHRWGMWVLDETRKEIGKFYPPDPDGTVPMAYLWARTVKCPNPKCGGELPLIRQLWLAKNPKRKVALKMVPEPKEKRVRFEVVEGKGINFDPKEGTMSWGTVMCPICKQSAKGDYLRAEAAANRLSQRMIAVVTRKGEESSRIYRIPTAQDEQIVQKANKFVIDLSTEIPNEPLHRPPMRIASKTQEPFWVSLQVVYYGMTNWGDLFNSRQAVTISTFAKKIREAHTHIVKTYKDDEYAKAVTTYLALICDRVADYTNKLSRWENTQERNVNVFSQQALPMVWDYAELNPLVRAVGSWEPMLDAIVRATEKLSGNNTPASVLQGSATRLPYPNESFDAVITDPPYYDSILYADLSDFFYVWLKRTIGTLYPEFFTTPYTPKGEEIVQNDSWLRRAKKLTEVEALDNEVKTRSLFEKRMVQALNEIRRVLKTQGIMAIVFAHKSTTAWEALITALLQAGFATTSSWPLHTESTTRVRAMGSASIVSSTWLICRKRDPNAPIGSWKKVQVDLEARVKERLEFFLSQGIRGSDALLSAIGPALEVFGLYSKVEKLTGETVTVEEFLDKIREVVSHNALTTVLEGNEMGAVDPPTSFYVLWKWSYEGREMASDVNTNGDETDEAQQDSSEKVEEKDGQMSSVQSRTRIAADDAFKFARSVGAEFDELTRPGGILRKEKEYAVLLGPEDRRGIAGLGETTQDGRPPPLIDVLHRTMNHWAAGEQIALEEYLDKSGARNNETLWKVAGALSRILALDSAEKRLIDGLWGRYGGGTAAGLLNIKGGKDQATLERYEKGV